MADHNKCAHLEIPDEYSKVFSNGESTLENIFNLQKNIQEKVYGYDFDELRESLGKVKGFLDWNKHALDDEIHEMYDALGGVNSHGNSIWKPWKNKFKEAQNKKFSDLTEEELLELRFEVIDAFHFLINMALVLDIDAKTFFNMYHAKNLENKNRQKNGY